MGWKITAITMTDRGVEKQAYTSDTGLSNPAFTHGFISGFAHAKGLKPEDIRFEYEEVNE